MKAFSLLITVLALCGLTSSAQESVHGGAQFVFDLIVVDLPEQSAVPLIPDLRDHRRAASATDRILKMVAEKNAALIAWQILTATNGQRAVTEQIDEFRYATEYRPGGNSTITDRYPDDTGLPNSPVVPVDPEEERPSPPTPKRITTTHSISEGIPVAFETRNLGVTLEMEAILNADGTHIDLNLVPQHVRLLRMETAVIEHKTAGTKIEVQQPRFATNKVTTSLTVADGDYTLLGSFKVAGAPERMELFILHSQIDTPKVTPPARKTR